MAHDYIDIDRVKDDFDDFLSTFGAPIYRKNFTSASTNPYYGTITYGVSTIESFTGMWRYVTAEDYRLILPGRAEVGDAVILIPSSVGIMSKTDEYWLKGFSETTDFFNITSYRPHLVGSQVAFYEAVLRRAKGKR